MNSRGRRKLASHWIALGIALAIPLAMPVVAVAQAEPDAVPATSGTLGEQPAPLIPIGSFAAISVLTDPTLSPDGKALSARMRKGDEQYLVVHEVFPGPDGKPISKAFSLGNATLNWVDWANDRYLITSLRFMYRFAGGDLPYDRLVLVDRQEPANNKLLGPEREGPSGDEVIYWAPDGSFLLLNLARSWFDYPDVIRVDIPSNTITKVEKKKTGIFRWVANNRGEIVAGIGFSGSGKLKVIYRADPTKSFETVLRMDIHGDDDSAEQVYIAHIDGETQKGYVLSRRGGDRWGLFEYDFKARTFGNPLFTHDKVDLDDYSFDRRGKLQWVSYVDDRWRVKWFDEDEIKFYADLEKAVPDKIALVISTSDNKETKIVQTMAPTDPGSFYLYTTTSGSMRLIGSVNDSLKGKKLAPVQYVSYKARDGLEIPAYLTVPVGRKKEHLPLIVMPHGGPFVRDEWAYDFLAQYLANRGYVVLQPNFRGSTGYGKLFEERGYMQFGKGMQDDVDDGVKWLIESGTADRERVCIVGWSYGGYVAQVAAFRNPEIYRCSVSIAGISDLAEMLRYDRRFMYGANFRKWSARIKGDSSTKSLTAVSSLTQVQAIGVPLLIVHGAEDDNVPVSQSDKLTKALKKAGKQFEYVRIEQGDHSLFDVDQRTRLLNALERFLATNNPTDVLTPAVSAPVN